MYKEYGKHGTLESTFFIAFPAGIVGARIAYVIGNWSKEFAGQPFWHVFAIWEGGLTILGGAIGGILVGVLFFIWRYKKQMSIWFAIDLVLPTILIAQAIGRWGNFFNCEVHGLVDSVDHWKWLPEIIWKNAQYSSTGLDLRGTEQMYVPLFFIECVSNLLGFFVLAHVFDKALHKYHEPGDIGCGYIIWYGMTRVLMEPLRSADYQMGDKGYWSWLWSMVYVIVGTLLIVVNHIVRNIIKKKNNTFEVKPYDTKLGSISSLIILAVGGALTGIGAYMMSTNSFETIVKYNGFNVGLIILVVGVSILLTLAISLPILFESFKNTPKEKELVKENSDENL
jgi:phosphatidylglycerol:prolipoprotein diacylglycerol transferase